MGAKRSRSFPKSVHAQFAKVLGKQHYSELSAIAKLRREWPKLVGPMLAERCEPGYIANETLWLLINHPSIAQQLRFLQDEIRDICQRKHHVTFKAIKTRLQAEAGIRPTRRKPVGHRIPAKTLEHIRHELEYIEDPELRQSLTDAWVAQLRFTQEAPEKA